MLGEIDLQNPLLWAIMIGWIMSVILHEFAHGLVAYWGGDYTIRERGGLTLNPIQYIDPVMSLILPVIFLAMGGIPLPGGATYVRRDLLRSRLWDSAVSAAGPAMNLILCLLLCIPLMPACHWVNYHQFPRSLATVQVKVQVFLGAMAFLQFFAAVLNLCPIPPLDGFGIIAPYLPQEFRYRITGRPWNWLLFLGFFMVIWKTPVFWNLTDNLLTPFLRALHIPPTYVDIAFNWAMYGRPF